ncbi:hypothetical protein FLONG3_7228 [Fusarium longipes]|uniref:Uncharacterized protein n=1 Tax=Fusarium longipes TaxID=694270 RepID=A0A395SFD1_9HYPO|nr:hypothetical protein FLONG3_7228 [Fusarium longipes]
MRYHLPAGVLLLSFGDCTYNPDTTTPECVSACSHSLMLHHDISTPESLCNDMAIQQRMFLCLASSCDDQYGQALADTVLTCARYGATISNLFPVQVHTDLLVSKQLFSLHARSDTAIFGFDNRFSLSIDCEAGSDGVLTLSLPDPTVYSNIQPASDGALIPPRPSSSDTNSWSSPPYTDPESKTDAPPKGSTAPNIQQPGLADGEVSAGSLPVCDGGCSGHSPAGPAFESHENHLCLTILLQDPSCFSANQPSICTSASAHTSVQDPLPATDPALGPVNTPYAGEQGATPPAGTIPYNDGVTDNNEDSPDEPPTSGVCPQLSTSLKFPQISPSRTENVTGPDTNIPSNDCMTYEGALGPHPEGATADGPVPSGQPWLSSNEDVSTTATVSLGRPPYSGYQDTSINTQFIPSPCQTGEDSNAFASGSGDAGSVNSGGSSGPSDLDPRLSCHTISLTQLPDLSQPTGSDNMGDPHDSPHAVITHVEHTATSIVTTDGRKNQDQELGTLTSDMKDQQDTLVSDA